MNLPAFFQKISSGIERAFDYVLLSKETLDLVDLNHVSDDLLKAIIDEDLDILVESKDKLLALNMRTASGKKKKELLLYVCWHHIRKIEEKY